MDLSGVEVARLAAMLASADPVPGGGAAAALAGGYGAALVAMVARVGRRRAGDEDVAHRLEEIAGRADDLSREMLRLAGEDAEAYTQVMRAYRLPRGSEAETRARSEAIRQALAAAAAVPMRSVRQAVCAMELLVEALPPLPSVALSDAGVAGWMIRAAIEGAALNVRANWQSMGSAPPGEYAQLEHLVANSRRLFDRVLQRLGPLANGGMPMTVS